MGQSLHYAITDVTVANPSKRRPSQLTMSVITASKSFFSMVNAVMLRPLPFAGPNRLVQIAEKDDKLSVNKVLMQADIHLRRVTFGGTGTVPAVGSSDIRERRTPQEYLETWRRRLATTVAPLSPRDSILLTVNWSQLNEELCPRDYVV